MYPLCSMLTTVTFVTFVAFAVTFGPVDSKTSPIKDATTSIKDAFKFKPIEDYVKEKGYQIENHEIETDDGFILMYHRIPHGKQGSGKGHGHPVLLVHGILQSSALYLAMKDGLPYLLADAGFDVWLANSRGNMYSKKWKNKSRGNEEFWNFSFHEMGKNDLPAAIDFILEVTMRPTLSYVGFSMGTTMFWVLADSWGARYMDRVDTMVAIAPIARPSHMSIVQKPQIYKTLSNALETFNWLHMYEIRPYPRHEGLLLRAACSKGNRQFCSQLLSGLLGLYSDSIHYDDTYISTQYMPAGTSVKTVQHFLQIGEKALFEQFDYGEIRNMVQYEFPTPPAYNLNKVTCPVFFIASDKDVYSVKEDVNWLATRLPVYPQTLFYDAVKDFNHLDFFYNKNVKTILFSPLVDFLTERRKTKT